MWRAARQTVTPVKWISLALIAVSLLSIVRSLPLDQAIIATRSWVAASGAWGPVVFAGTYIVATVLFVPGLLLTMAGGAIFGLWVGTLAVSIGSTIGSVLAFAIARYAARDKVATLAQRNPRFGAIDRAIEEGGWKIVALLRLSPAIPFNLQNYLYGLTRVRFLPYMLTSWIAMLPGTFMYVYIGHVAGLAVDQDRARAPGEWVMLAVGLLATVVVTVYVTKLARRQLRSQLETAQTAHPDQAAGPSAGKLPETTGPGTPAAGYRGVLILVSVAVVVSVAAVYLRVNPAAAEQLLVRWFGPPRVTLQESYSEKPDGPTCDHSLFNDLLTEFVDDDGWVDYEGLRADSQRLDQYLDVIAHAPLDEMGRSERLALLINTYNACTLKLIVENWPLTSIKDIPAAGRWDDVRWIVGSHVWSLSQIEQEEIRGHFKEPRIHFALVCGAVGCPPLRNEAYTAARLDDQLEQQTRYVHDHGTWFQWDEASNVVRLTALYNWYGDDFRQVAGSPLDFAARYLPRLKQRLDSGNPPSVEWLPYDWTLNSRPNRTPRG